MTGKRTYSYSDSADIFTRRNTLAGPQAENTARLVISQKSRRRLASSLTLRAPELSDAVADNSLE